MDTPNNIAPSSSGSSIAASTNAKKHGHRYALLALVLAGVVVVVGVIAVLAGERIASNERAWFLAHLEALVPPTLHDNDLYKDRTVVNAPDLLGTGTAPIYRARRGGKPVAVIMTVVAREGYGGDIELLVGVDYAGALLGVEVLRHNETQGIGDGFVAHRSNWLRNLIGRSIENPESRRWTIHKDGGEFEQFTGASVTPRAILKAVRLALEYYAANREKIFDAAPTHDD